MRRGLDALVDAALAGNSTSRQAASSGGIQLFGIVEEDGVLLDGAEQALLPWPVLSMVEYAFADRVSLTLVGQRPVITGVVGGTTDDTIWETQTGLENLGDEVEHVTGLQNEHSDHLTELDEKLKDVDDVLDEVTENLKDVGKEVSDAKESAASSAQSAKDSLEQAIKAGEENVRDSRQEFSLGSETVAGTSWTSTAPNPPKGQYLWQRTILTYGNGETVTLPAFRSTGLPGAKGEDGAGIEIAGSVTTYANLPKNLTAGDAGKGYLVEADGLLYIWDGTHFPANGKGVEFRGPGGADGANGVGVQSITPFFALSGAKLEVPTTLRNGKVYADTGATLTRPTNLGQVSGKYCYDAGLDTHKAVYDPMTKKLSIMPVNEAVPQSLPPDPTGVTPPAPWQDTEPPFQAGMTLYRSDRVLYDDNRVQWTPVTVSSAYEGAVQAMHVANLAQAAAEGLLTIGPDAPEHGPGRVWMQTDEDGNLTGLFQSVSGVWAVYTMITGVLIVPGADGTPTVIDQNGMVIGSIAAESITGLEIAAETIQAYHLVLSSIGKEYLDGEAQGTLEDAEKWAALTLLEPGRITITAGGDRTTKMILDAQNLDFVVGGESRAYIDAKRNLMSIGSALIQENLQVGFHMQTALAGTSVTVVRYVG